MKLDYDCIRDILLCVEGNTTLRKRCYFVDNGLEESTKLIGGEIIPLPDYQEPLTSKYGNDKFIYHVQYCINADLLIGIKDICGYQIGVADLSPSGHELIGKIRDDKQWNKINSCFFAVRNYSLSAISSIAEGVTSAAINAYFSGQLNH